MNACIPLFAAALVTAGAAFPYQPAPPPEVNTRVVIAERGGGSYLGIGVAEITAERAKALNLREERGVEITRVEEGSPAEKGGLKTGDVMLEYNGQRVEGLEQFMRMVRETPPGREVKLSFSRGGSLQQAVVRTGQRKGFAPGRDITIPRELPLPELTLRDFPRPTMSWRSAALGIEGEALDGQLAQFFGVKDGVLVRSVIKGAAGEKAGLKAGDVITKVDGTQVGTPREITSALRSSGARKPASLTIVREKREMTVTVPLDDSKSEFLPPVPSHVVSA